MARVNLKTSACTATGQTGAIELPITATHEERDAAVKQAIATGHPIAIAFAKFNDGRGFSVARLIRSGHGFRGEILATGHTIPDQALHLLRCGIDTVEVADASRLAQWKKSLASYGSAYQPAANNPLALRRHAAQLPTSPEKSRKPARDRLKTSGLEPFRDVA